MAWIKNSRNQKQGAVMILVLGVLVILALLATTFVRIQTGHKEVSGSFTDDIRAKLVAQSGIEDALDRLKSLGNDSTWMFQGNDINEDGQTTAAEVDAAYGETTVSPATIEWAKNPSYAWEVDDNPTDALNPQPRIVNITSTSAGLPAGSPPRRWGVSGTLGGYTNTPTWGTYANHGDLYAVKVNDSSGLIYLNDGVAHLGAANAPTYNASTTKQSAVAQNLKMILNSLGKVTGCATPNIGNVIVNARPAITGFAIKDEIQNIVGTGDYLKIKDFVTTNAWIDKNVVNPVPLSAAAQPYYDVKYHRGSAANPAYRRSGGGTRASVDYKDQAINTALMFLGTTPSTNGGSVATNAAVAGVYGLDELFPQYVEVAWRAPVNANTAEIEVLESLIAEVQGFFLLERRSGAPHENSPATFNMGGPAYGGWGNINCPMTRNAGGSAAVTDAAPGWGWSWLYGKHSYSPGSPANYTAVASNCQTIQVGNVADFDEVGYLYSTARYAGSWEGTGGGGVVIPARTVAAHMIACRKARPGIPATLPQNIEGVPVTIDYSTKHFGGPFRSWAQFYEFIDFLVDDAGGPGPDVIKDARTGFWQGYTATPWVASQAAADALKANFNPNCHLNEANPDRNLFLWVDKTDLIRNTTEFCFRPTGYFEVEALGRVLRPTTNVGDAMAAGVECEIRGEKKVTVAIKQFDLYRETSQRHFYPGALAPRVTYSTAVGAADSTNNNMSLEVGPEPDNSAAMVYDDLWSLGSAWPTAAVIDGYVGVKPVGSVYSWTTTGWGYEFDGYIQLATLGGPIKYATVAAPIPFSLDNVNAAPVPFSPGRKTAKPQTVGMSLTEAGNAALTPNAGETMQGHFAFNDVLSYAAGTLWWRRENISSNTTDRSSSAQSDFSNPSWFSGVNNPKNETFTNYKDYSVADTSPYFTAKGSQYRLARSFRMPLVGGGTGSGTVGPNLPYLGLANSDLRMDGLYVERHAGAAYWIDEGVTFSNTLGTISAWIKPSWHPEYSGKARNLFAMARYHARVRGYNAPQNLNLMYMPAHVGPGLVNHQDIGTGTTGTVYAGNPYSSGDDAPETATGGQYMRKFRPASLFFDTWQGCFDGGLDDGNHEGPWLEYHYGHNTFTLNHDDPYVTGTHKTTHATWPDHLDGHRWSHVTHQWFNNPADGTQYTTNHASRTWLNGRLVGGKEPGDLSATGTGVNAAKTPVSNKTTWFRAGTLFQSGHGWGAGGQNERPYMSMNYWGTSSGSQHRTNALRLGEASYHGIPISATGSEVNTYPRNWTADCTFDELYMWKGPSNVTFSYASEANTHYYGAGRGSDMFRRGRYYHPQVTVSPTESFFISPWIDFGGLSASRLLAPATTAAAPAATGGEGGSVPPNTISVPAAALSQRTLVGIAWTWHAEDYDTAVPQLANNTWGRMIPIARDWTNLMNGTNPQGDVSASNPSDWTPNIGPQTVSEAGGLLQGMTTCRVFLDLKSGTGTTQYPLPGTMQGAVNVGNAGYVEDGYSAVNVALGSGTLVRYKVWFQIQGLTGNHCLLESPYFDDITFYFDNGGTQFLSWSIQ